MPAQKLLNYLKLLPSGRVNLKVLTNDQRQINSGHSRTRMPGLAPESYPAIAPPPLKSIPISVRALRYGIHRRIHQKGLFGISDETPIVILAIDEEQKLREMLPVFVPMVREGLINLIDTEVISFGADRKDDPLATNTSVETQDDDDD